MSAPSSRETRLLCTDPHNFLIAAAYLTSGSRHGCLQGLSVMSVCATVLNGCPGRRRAFRASPSTNGRSGVRRTRRCSGSGSEARRSFVANVAYCVTLPRGCVSSSGCRLTTVTTCGGSAALPRQRRHPILEGVEMASPLWGGMSRGRTGHAPLGRGDVRDLRPVRRGPGGARNRFPAVATGGRIRSWRAHAERILPEALGRQSGFHGTAGELHAHGGRARAGLPVASYGRASRSRSSLWFRRRRRSGRTGWTGISTGGRWRVFCRSRRSGRTSRWGCSRRCRTPGGANRSTCIMRPRMHG